MKAKKIKYVSIFVLGMVVIGISCFIIKISPLLGGILPPPGSKKMESYFLMDSQNMVYVSGYLKNLNYDDIRIDENDGNNQMYVSNDDEAGQDIFIEESKLKEHINTLYEHGFGVIEKHNNYVQFSKWSSLDSSRGIVCSFTDDEPFMEDVIELTPLSVEHWYYYEHNRERSERN